MKLKYSILFMFPLIACASGSLEANSETDIIPRVINFAIFASILYYLLAKPIKDYFNGRTNEIADRLTAIQDKLKESRNEKDMASQKLKDCELTANEITETAKVEADMLVGKIEQNLITDLNNLQKSHDERVDSQTKKMTKETVSEIVEDIFAKGKVDLNSADLLNIIKKKVA